MASDVEIRMQTLDWQECWISANESHRCGTRSSFPANSLRWAAWHLARVWLSIDSGRKFLGYQTDHRSEWGCRSANLEALPQGGDASAEISVFETKIPNCRASRALLRMVASASYWHIFKSKNLHDSFENRPHIFIGFAASSRLLFVCGIRCDR